MVSIYDVQVKCDSCGAVGKAVPPKNRRKYGVAGALLLGLIGGIIGASVGIATAGVGAPAAPFTLVIGLYSGLMLGRWGAEKQDGVSCSECDASI